MTKCPLVKEVEDNKKELTDQEAFDKMHEADGTQEKEELKQ